ncbi:Hypothetical protein A7982_04523 [Minicystis rosea]|nr:Hypothetical protein A7982_04523 [Minicystis rosea]
MWLLHGTRLLAPAPPGEGWTPRAPRSFGPPLTTNRVVSTP